MFNKMHENPNYIRLKGPKGEEIGVLGYECGSHCQVVTVGHSHQKVGHCPCPDCHNGKTVAYGEPPEKTEDAV